MDLPKEFIARMQRQLGEEADAFFYALEQPPPTSIRLHHTKGRTSFNKVDNVPWCKEGFYLEMRPLFHLDPHWHGGAYYVQEASSMILDAILSQTITDDRARIWLDMCAAPGGKTGIIAKHKSPQDILVANEVVPARRTILWENLYKAGYVNTIITGEQASVFNEPLFDVVLVDAPCAGEGMMRKDEEAIRQWSSGLVRECSLLQKRIAHNVIESVNAGGYLIYSTCSYSQEENIENVLEITQKFPFTSIALDFPAEWNISTIEKNGATGYQLYPHKVKGEGLFISVLQNVNDNPQSKTKKSTAQFSPLPAPISRHLDRPENFRMLKNTSQHAFVTVEAETNAIEVLSKFPKAEVIANAGELKGKDFIPSHFLAMAGLSTPVENIDLPLDQSLDYLERQVKSLPADKSPGWYQVSFKGTTLGWAKNTSQGWKNHYPLTWRLRSRRMT